MKFQPVVPAASLGGVVPGLLAAMAIAGAAGLAATWTNGPIMLFALLFGMAANFIGKQPGFAPGIAFTSKFVLRLGVALLGFKITMGDVIGLGWGPILLVIAAIALTICCSAPVARWMGFDPRFGILSGGATAICGASAAMALSAAMPDHPKKQFATLFTIVGVSTLSTAAMLLYPVIAHALKLDDHHAGIFIGASVHDVAQVVGAGYAISPEAGDTATIVKLARVAMLLPVILAVGLYSRSSGMRAEDRPPLLPWFVTAFAVLVVAGSVLQIPTWLRDAGNGASRFCLVASIAALGVKTRFADIVSAGWKPAVLMVAQTVFIAGIALGAILAGWV
ncbi:MAG TPA: putative sulfate exporter family transporter [Sphingomicrobium sp.]|nr:putative sulfate exporter family transporter [Sphingomicrobium sp.]